jgi:hypothetical protein
MTSQSELVDWHQSRIEALILDVGERLALKSETTISFQYPRPERFRRAVLRQLEWSGYIGRFERDHESGLPRLVVRRPG